jgi:hypothetical protein
MGLRREGNVDILRGKRGRGVRLSSGEMEENRT